MSLYGQPDGGDLPGDEFVDDVDAEGFYDSDMERDFPPASIAYGGGRMYGEPRCEIGDCCITLPLEEVLPTQTLESDFSIATILPDDPREGV